MADVDWVALLNEFLEAYPGLAMSIGLFLSLLCLILCKAVSGGSQQTYDTESQRPYVYRPTYATPYPQPTPTYHYVQQPVQPQQRAPNVPHRVQSYGTVPPQQQPPHQRPPQPQLQPPRPSPQAQASRPTAKKPKLPPLPKQKSKYSDVARQKSAKQRHQPPPPEVPKTPYLPPSPTVAAQPRLFEVHQSTSAAPQPPVRPASPIERKGRKGRQGVNVPNQDNQYFKDLRQKALDERDAMERSRDLSKKAFNVGNHNQAKILANESKRHRAEMNRFNAEASNWIFQENNRDLPPGEVDLHGLYVDEAIDRTEQAIRGARRSGLRTLRAITGKGLHASKGVPRIKPAIEALAARHQLPSALDPRNEGVLVITLVK